jgi:signal transduction histidine kinase/ActR/RegA family two-component response regulator
MKLQATLARLWRRAWRFDEPRLLAAQMRLLERNVMPASVIATLVALITAEVGSRYGLTPYAWQWACGLLTVKGACLLYHHYGMPDLADASQAPRYAQQVRVVAGLTGACWGAMGVIFIDPAQPQSIAIVLGISSGINSGGLAVFAPSWPVAVVYWLTNMAPVVFVLLRSHTEFSVLMGMAGLLYLIAMIVFSYFAAQSTRQGIELGFENEGLVTRLRDQTQRALEARQMAESALIDAEDANRAKTVFLASASHDLRQPLHAMGLFLSALARADLNERQTQLLVQAQASALATGDMLSTLMDFSKVDAGVIKPSMQPFALQPLFYKLAREMAPLAEEKGLAFRLRDTSLVLHADPGLVEMILRNLLLNAIRYTDHGAVLVGCRRRGLRAVVEVWDTGVGIPAQQHQLIFREFHQLGNPERDRRKGLGLGLAIVDGLARAMSVDVSLASRPGKGSVFRLTLPVSMAPWQEQAQASPDEPDLSGLRVLLIEDDDTVRAAMGDLLATWGCWCEGAGSSEEAMVLLDQFDPDVVLTDYRLRSHHTGLQALQAVRERAGREVPAALITGDTAPERLREAHESGLTLLHKPVSAERLQAVLFSLWREASANEAAAASARG